jgi:hypothetical protein
MPVAWRDRGGGSLLGQYGKARPAIIIDEKDLLTAIAALGNVTWYFWDGNARGSKHEEYRTTTRHGSQ